jgi:signal transduction histidine kinase
VLALREGEARLGLARANAELRATRALLAEATRADERGRIARELHDVLGHTLTALGLQLEVARNVPPDRAPAHVAKARALADDALAGVRGAVSAMRAERGPDVGRALRDLCADTPGLTVHLDLPEPFVIEHAARANCLVRCVQEILTNALRHAAAENLWIRVERTPSLVTVDARDDGRGASEVRAGNGLAGMRARIEEMGGRLVIAATPAFSLSAQLPVDGAS